MIGSFVIFATTIFALNSSYVLATGEALRRGEERNRARAGDFAGEALWYAIYQVNYLFFVTFALLGYVVLPQCDWRKENSARREAFPSFGLVHAAGSILPAAIVVFARGRTRLF